MASYYASNKVRNFIIEYRNASVRGISVSMIELSGARLLIERRTRAGSMLSINDVG